MSRYRTIVAIVLLTTSLGSGTATAQLQMQEQTVGAPQGGPLEPEPPKPPQPPAAPSKRTAAECQSQAKQHHLRGNHARTFISNCLKS